MDTYIKNTELNNRNYLQGRSADWQKVPGVRQAWFASRLCYSVLPALTY